MPNETKQKLNARLWDGAEQLRGKMDAAKYKDYMLGIMFYKFLSDRTLLGFSHLVNPEQEVVLSSQDSISELVNEYRQVMDNPNTRENVSDLLMKDLGYYVQPEDLYQAWVESIDTNSFEVERISTAFNNFQRNIQSSANLDDFEGLFSSIDVNSQDLGANLNERNKNLRSLIQLFSDLDMNQLQKTDILGDAYEYLVGQFGLESGKKAGEFYTPRQVSEVIAQVVTSQTTNVRSVYDPTVGSGSLLLTVAKHVPDTDGERKKMRYFGQELNTATYNLARMNLLLHGVQPDHFTIRNADTLRDDWPEDEKNSQQSRQFDVVVMNPPYSYNWSKGEDSAYANARITDSRWQDYGAIAPKTAADYAFLLHGLYHLDHDGTMAIVLPHGVLFRGGVEATIRENLLKKNQIDAIIGMPANLFTNTGIPVVIVVLKKNREIGRDTDVLIVDASSDFIKVGNHNELRARDIAKIVDTVASRSETVGYSYKATFAEIQMNDYNLNISRYVQKIQPLDIQDVDGHLLGGIPKVAIDSLKVLQMVAPGEYTSAFTIIRPGYVEPQRNTEEISQAILGAKELATLRHRYSEVIREFADDWFSRLTSVVQAQDMNRLQTEMMDQAKVSLTIDRIVDGYAAYQLIAELWESTLLTDTELITQKGLLEAGRGVHIVYKSKKVKGKEIQVEDGRDGDLLPMVLLEEFLFPTEFQKLTDFQNTLDEADSTLDRLKEDAKDDEELSAQLFDEDKLFSKRDRPLVKDLDSTVDNKLIDWLQEYSNAETAKAECGKAVKELSSELETEALKAYTSLTLEQIKLMLREKWFAGFESDFQILITNMVNADLKQLSDFSERYACTLQEIQDDKAKKQQEFMSLAALLVRTGTSGSTGED